jgi:hypothetical protein
MVPFPDDTTTIATGTGQGGSSHLPGDVVQPPDDAMQLRGDPASDGYRLDRLSPLLHQLLDHDLVVQDDSGAFVLRPEIQQRLAEAVAKAPRFAAEVYVGRHCERCGTIGITRLTEGRRLCAPCAAYLESPATAEPPTSADAKRRRWVKRARRYRDAG